jgi:hypothetical protein
MDPRNLSMSTPSTPIGGLSPDAFASVFQAINGLRNRRALIAMVGCLFAGLLLFGLFAFLAARLGAFIGLLGGLCLFVAGATGINAAGVLLLEQAKGVPSRSLMDAIVHGLMCIPKFILLGLALFAVALAVFVAIAIVYLVCKIPVLGPILFVLVFPLSVVVCGLTLCGLFLCMALALPAIWEGATITRAITQALAIARSRLVESMLLMAAVWVLSVLVGVIVFGVLFAGLMPSVGMTAAILGGEGLGSMMGMMRHRGEFGGMDGSVATGGSGYAMAADIGGGLLWALAGSLLSLVNLLGLNLVYLRVTEGLDDAKRRAAGLGQKATEAAAPAAARPHAPPAFSPAPPAAQPPKPREPPSDATIPAMRKLLSCPQCASVVGREDVYCGVCGHRLK